MEQLNQNQVPASSGQQVKNSSSKRTIILAVLFILVVVGLSVALYIRNNAMQSQALPQNNTFYSAIYNKEPVLFFRNQEMHMSGIPANPQMGRYVSYQNADMAKHHSESYADFRKLQNAKKLFTFDRYATIENFKLSEDKNYLSMSFLGGNNDTTNYIYEVNLKTAESKKIWEHQLGEGEAPYNSGTAYITNYEPDRYVVFAFIKGEPAPVGKPGGVVIKNIKTGKEKVLGVVSDVQIDLSGQKVSFKKIGEAKAPCADKDPQCFATDTYKIVYEPTGESITQPLP